jgi:uncharacterized protein (TIGR01370 family)
VQVTALFILASLLLTRPPAASVREQLHSIENYVVYYGSGQLEELARFDLAILQPDAYDEGELAELKSGGTLTAAYLSVGEAEGTRDWFDEVQQEWILGYNADWDSYFIDANQEGWRELMIEQAGDYLTKGFDGIFLDTVDTADIYPQTGRGMLQLIAQLRETYPNTLLIQNRGFGIVEQTTEHIDAVMFEDLSTGYDFETETYIHLDNHEDAEFLADVREHTGIVVLALDYATPGDIETAAEARAIAQNYGFVPAVSVIFLDDILTYDSEP